MSRDVLRKIACREEILGPGAKGYRSLGTNEVSVIYNVKLICLFIYEYFFRLVYKF